MKSLGATSQLPCEDWRGHSATPSGSYFVVCVGWVCVSAEGGAGKQFSAKSGSYAKKIANFLFLKKMHFRQNVTVFAQKDDILTKKSNFCAHKQVIFWPKHKW